MDDIFESLSTSLIDLKNDYSRVARDAKFYLDYLGDAYVDGSLDSVDLQLLNEVASNITAFHQEMVNKNQEVTSTLKKLKDILDKTFQ